jgi:hypothetical protein
MGLHLSIVPLHILYCVRLQACHTPRRRAQWAAGNGALLPRPRIELSVGLDGDAWKVSLFIYYSEGLQNIAVTFPVGQEFKTYDDAVEAGLAAAKKWIDGRMSNSGRD